MARITEEQTKVLIDHYFKTIENIPPALGMKMAKALNELMQVKLGQPLVSENMFRIGNYECSICCGIKNKMHVDFYEIKRYKKPRNGQTHITTFSHRLPFDIFCYRYCNPWMAFVFEKVAFEVM